MRDLSLGDKLKIGELEMDLRLDFWFCPDHGVFIPRLFQYDWDSEQGCPVPGGSSYGESTCGKDLRSVNLADWDYPTVRIEINRGVYQVPRKATSGKALRDMAEIPEGEDLYGKGDPVPGRELAGPNGEGWLVAPGQLIEPRDGMEFYSTLKDGPTIFSGIPIQIDTELGPNQIKLIDGAGLTHIYELTDGEDLVEITI